MTTYLCGICGEERDDANPPISAEVAHWRTARRNGRPSLCRELVCPEHTAGTYALSADGRHDVYLPGNLDAATACVVCGVRVRLRPDKRRRVVVCSDTCRSRFYAARRPVTVSVTHCEGCGAEMTGRSDRRYCSPACRQRAYRHRELSREP